MKKTFKLNEKVRTVRLLLTDKCNLDCMYCCSEGHKPKFNNFNTNNIHSIISVLNQFLDIERFKITGGEPLILREFNSIIDTIQEEKKDFQMISIVTNGTYPEKVESLLKYPSIDLTISLPTLDEEKYIEIVGKDGEFQKVMRSIDILLKSNINFKINSVLIDEITNTKENIESIIKKYGQNHNLKIRFLEMSKNSVNQDKISKKALVSTQETFNKNMLDLGFIKSEEAESREATYYSKEGIIIKYIKFFCSDDCTKCPDGKSSLWIACDGSCTKCSYEASNEFNLSSFSYDDIYNDFNIRIK